MEDIFEKMNKAQTILYHIDQCEKHAKEHFKREFYSSDSNSVPAGIHNWIVRSFSIIGFRLEYQRIENFGINISCRLHDEGFSEVEKAQLNKKFHYDPGFNYFKFSLQF
jgi:hypothetical protein